MVLIVLKVIACLKISEKLTGPVCFFFFLLNAIKSNHRFPEERLHRTMHFSCQLLLHAVPVILAFSTSN